MSDRKGISGSTILILMFLVFLVLRITGAIQWKWYAVATPIWIIIGINLLVLLLGFLSDIYDSKKYFRPMKLPDTKELREALSMECSSEQMKSDKYARSILSEIKRIEKCDTQNSNNIRKLQRGW